MQHRATPHHATPTQLNHTPSRESPMATHKMSSPPPHQRSTSGGTIAMSHAHHERTSTMSLDGMTSSTTGLVGGGDHRPPPSTDDEDEGDELLCPLCMEEIDITDKYFKPCPCGYQICRFCWNHIKENLNGLCPACRRPYTDESVQFRPVSPEELSRIKNNKKKKEKEKKTMDSATRKHLSNVRIVQKNLVYILGLPSKIAVEDVLRTHDYFSQYGKITKVVINKKTLPPNANHAHPVVNIGVYITYSRKDDAAKAIDAVDGCSIDGRVIRATFGTTKYCTYYLKGIPCQNPGCQFLHEPGEEAEQYARDESKREIKPKPAPFPGSKGVGITKDEFAPIASGISLHLSSANSAEALLSAHPMLEDDRDDPRMMEAERRGEMQQDASTSLHPSHFPELGSPSPAAQPGTPRKGESPLRSQYVTSTTPSEIFLSSSLRGTLNASMSLDAIEEPLRTFGSSALDGEVFYSTPARQRAPSSVLGIPVQPDESTSLQHPVIRRYPTYRGPFNPFQEEDYGGAMGIGSLSVSNAKKETESQSKLMMSRRGGPSSFSLFPTPTARMPIGPGGSTEGGSNSPGVAHASSTLYPSSSTYQAMARFSATPSPRTVNGNTLPNGSSHLSQSPGNMEGLQSAAPHSLLQQQQQQEWSSGNAEALLGFGTNGSESFPNNQRRNQSQASHQMAIHSSSLNNNNHHHQQLQHPSYSTNGMSLGYNDLAKGNQPTLPPGTPSYGRTPMPPYPGRSRPMQQTSNTPFGMESHSVPRRK